MTFSATKFKNAQIGCRFMQNAPISGPVTVVFMLNFQFFINQMLKRVVFRFKLHFIRLLNYCASRFYTVYSRNYNFVGHTVFNNDARLIIQKLSCNGL